MKAILLLCLIAIACTSATIDVPSYRLITKSGTGSPYPYVLYELYDNHVRYVSLLWDTSTMLTGKTSGKPIWRTYPNAYRTQRDLMYPEFNKEIMVNVWEDRHFRYAMRMENGIYVSITRTGMNSGLSEILPVIKCLTCNNPDYETKAIVE